MMFLIFWLCALIIAVIHVLVRKPRSLEEKIKIFLFYQVVIGFVLGGLIGAIGHCIFYEQTARGIGWAPHKQFQFELGASELGWAIAGVMAIFIKKPIFWLGVSIIPMVMMIISACQHVWEMVATGNFATYNIWAGAVDFIGPLTLIILFGLYFKASGKARSTVLF
jgi:hypothetical protein